MRVTVVFALSVLLLGLCVSSCRSGTAVIPTESASQLAPSPSIQQPNPTPLVTISEFQKWTLQQVTDAFKAAGLEVGTVRKNNSSDLYGAPLVAVEFGNFNVPSRGVDAGGLILIFSSKADLESVYKYYKDAGWYDNGLYYPWVYRKDNVLLQINGILSDVEAGKYGEALEQLR